MKLYRFSPIENDQQLHEAIIHVHTECYSLCKNALGKHHPNTGNIGIFCHYQPEYDNLISVRNSLVFPSDNPDQKYFELVNPIVIAGDNGVPETTYTHLYIRKPDPYRHHVGDVDFYIAEQDYSALKARLQNGENIEGARIFPRNDLDMIELHNPDIDALGYVSTVKMAKSVHVKKSDETNL